MHAQSYLECFVAAVNSTGMLTHYVVCTLVDSTTSSNHGEEAKQKQTQLRKHHSLEERLSLNLEEIEKEREDWNRERKELREYEKEIKKKMAELDEKEVWNLSSYSSY